MYQSKPFAKHNKNPLALIQMYIYLCVCVYAWLCLCLSLCFWAVWSVLCVMCVLWLCCKSANTPCCQLADIKARESFFLLLCRRVVEGVGVQGRQERGRGMCCKAACMTACVAYNYNSRAPKGWQHLLLQKTKWLHNHFRQFPVEVLRSLRMLLADAWHGLLYSHFSCARL